MKQTRHYVIPRLFIVSLSTTIAVIASALPGCGGDPGLLPVAPVAGSLAIDGKPVANGTIHFHPQKGQPASGIIKDGKFTLTTYKENDGAVIGKHRVALDVGEEVPTKDGDTTTKSLIPKKLTTADSSGIELDIPAGGKPNLQIDILTAGGVKIKE